MARELISACAAGLLLCCAAPAGAVADVVRETDLQRVVPGEALVRFEPGVDAAERRAARADADVSFEESLRLARTQVVSFDGSVHAAVERLEDEPGVAYAQPNYRYRALASVPNDTHFGQLWGMDPTPGTGVLAAWDRTRGAGQVIAILDTGVDLTHPDLAGNLWTRPGQPGVHGHDFVDDDTDPDDLQFHGTHVAGTAAAIDGNGIGVAGVAPDAQIMAVRVLDGDGGGSTATISEGILFASAEGAGVINMSLGGPSGAGDTVMGNAAATAEQRGSVIVAAAGNAGGNNDQFPTSPCNLPNANVLCVAAVDNQSNLASYSNFGATTVDVAAPGGDTDPGDVEILSTKTAWGAPLFTEDFEVVTDWTATTPSGLPWGQSATAAGGSFSAADSPVGNYQNNTQSQLQATNPVSLAGREGCRMHFLTRFDIEPFDPRTGELFDFLAVGAVAAGGSAGVPFAGSTNGSFFELDTSISDLDGQSVRPTLQFSSDASIVDDGAYVDDLRLLCRASGPGDYDNVALADSDDFELPASSGGGSYMAISGTSMASPHAAGVAALVRAADPGVPPSQVVQAMRNGAKPLPDLAGVTVTGGAVDAVASMEAALALPNSSPSTTPPPPPPPPAPGKPARASFAGRVTADARGRLRIRVSGDPGTRGTMTLTANLPRGSAAARRVVARKAVRIGASGRATVRLRLSRPALRVLRRTRRLRVSAKVVLANAAGLRSTSTKPARIALRSGR